jgi:flagellar basal-body rod protein FlgB
VFDSVTSRALVSALDGLALRQRVIAHNIANVNTPDFTARTVEFERELADSVAQGEGAVSARIERSRGIRHQDGNNVNLETETLTNIETVLRYQFATQAIGSETSGLRTAMRTS